MKYALIKDSQVTNVIEAEPDKIESLATALGVTPIQSDNAQIGYILDGEILRDMTTDEKLAASIANRSTAEKLRDNKCLDLITEVNLLTAQLIKGTLNPEDGLNIQINESCDAVMFRAISLGLDSDATVTTKLLTLERLVKGVTLPTEKHVIEA